MKLLFAIVVCILFAGIALFISCKKEHSYEEGTKNHPPVAEAGVDTLINLPEKSVWLDGTASHDPDNNIRDYSWIKISGPSSFNIYNPSAVKTKVDQLGEGIYQFELKVTDGGGLFSLDTIMVTVVKPITNNRRPIANAGADQTIVLPTNSVLLDGHGSTDPDNNITSYAWTKLSGPPSFNINTVNAVQTQVTNLVQGNYQFELTVTDAGGLFSKDTAQINVIPAINNNACNNSNRPQVSARLVPVGSLSEVGAGMAVASAGNKIVFAGAELFGWPQTYGSSRVDIYDMITQTWSTAELSQRRSGIAVVAAGNKIFFAGGRLTDGALDQLFSAVDIYDVSANTWSVANLSEPRSYIAAATVGSKVFFAGGEKDSTHNASTKVDVYDLSTNAWSSASLSIPRANISAVTVNSKIYFAGGNSQNRTYSPSDRIDIYDNIAHSWSTSSLKEPMGPLAGITAGGNIYWAQDCAVEIRNVNTLNSSISYLFKSGGAWIIDNGQDIVLKDGKLVFFRHSDAIVDKFDIYDISTKTWSIGVLAEPAPKWATIISVNNTIYVVGGAINGVLSNQVWKLEF
jgi:N-acetylneuraminic acid mutarotase